MGKASKATRKFASSGQLKKTIQSRKKHQQVKKKIDGRRGAKGKGKVKAPVDNNESGDEDEEVQETKGQGKTDVKGMTVDDFLGAGFMENDSDDEENMDQANSDEAEDEEDVADDQSFASIDDLEDDGAAHMLELSKLAEKDPEFYKYLQENDMDLLEFNPTEIDDGENDENDEEEEDEDEDVKIESEKLPILTKEILRGWQKALLDHRSLRALRKLLIAFRSAAHMNEDNQVLAWSIDSSTMYNKLVTAAFKFTPVVLAHHIPYKTLPNGKYKPPTQTAKQKALQKLILSYFNNIVHLIPQLTDEELLQLAFAESAKIIPYIITSRKAAKAYLKKCLEVWSSGKDSVRIAAFLSIRKLASSADDAIRDLALKSTYLELVRSSKSTSIHKLPSINLMKNSASEIFCLDHTAAYQHAFGYIRQLAIHLRNSMKTKTKEAYRQVYNWQYVHCVDFWALVLARACSTEARAERGEESELKALIYPLVQVSLGAIKLISNARSYPFHLHIARSMLHLSRHTNIYIPLTPYLLPIISAPLTASGKPKPSTLRPLDFESNIRVPAQYLKTRVYMEGLVDEAAFILAEWLASTPVHGSIAFPEITVPVVVSLRKTLKSAKSKSKGATGKETGIVKGLVERVEESAKWIEQKRKNLSFSPGNMSDVERWEANFKAEDSPLAKYVKVQRKARVKRKNLVEKAEKGEDEILEDD
ncbi:Noc2-domain-containing protein [Paxillus ammoniavirescens]|nr:Noc2-domain-containing protein [Paxillus ammoniavirescens]